MESKEKLSDNTGQKRKVNNRASRKIKKTQQNNESPTTSKDKNSNQVKVNGVLRIDNKI